MMKILYGVCGIGNGHTYRQLPIIEHLAQNNKIIILAYGYSLKFYVSRFTDHPNVKVMEVAVPYYVGGHSGIDFVATALKAAESNIDYLAINSTALNHVGKHLGKPDLVISDYEPVSAQYAYAYDAPVVTIDQQSKYLSGDFPGELNGQTYIDEVMRLRMFFPKAAARIACSFFAVSQSVNAEIVELYPPVLRPELVTLKKGTKRNNTILLYLTSQPGFEQDTIQLLEVLDTRPGVQFHVFAPNKEALDNPLIPDNVSLHARDNIQFLELLGSCTGVITTAGHTLLSEAMYLETPVLALPLPIYEQQMNANIIESNKFGVASTALTPGVLSSFIDNLPLFTDNIKRDTKVLLRGDGRKKILDFLKQNFSV